MAGLLDQPRMGLLGGFANIARGLMNPAGFGMAMAPMVQAQAQGMGSLAMQANQAMPWGGNDPSAIGIDTQAGTIDPSVMVPFASNVAGMAATGGIVSPKPAGALGIFGGRMAKTADLDALAKAEQMAAQGVDRGAIWTETGWFQGVDGKWRFEIPDDAARLGQSIEDGSTVYSNTKFLKDYFPHKQAYAAYDFPQMYSYGKGPQQSGSHAAPEYSLIRPEERNYAGLVKAEAPNDEILRNTTLHEMQHHVQDIEEFARGGNMSHEAALIAAERDNALVKSALESLDPAVAAKILRYEELKETWASRQGEMPQEIIEEVTALKNDPSVRAGVATVKASVAELRSKGRGGALERGAVSRADAFKQYQRLAGETEARNVEARSRMTPEQRQATPPWMTQEFPDEDQIIRMSLK